MALIYENRPIKELDISVRLYFYLKGYEVYDTDGVLALDLANLDMAINIKAHTELIELKEKLIKEKQQEVIEGYANKIFDLWKQMPNSPLKRHLSAWFLAGDIGPTSDHD